MDVEACWLLTRALTFQVVAMTAQGLLEREQELEQLEHALTAVPTSGGQIVLLRGEAGIGKTALIREFVRRHDEEATVLVGTCDDLMTPQPLGPLWDISRREPSISRSLHDSDRPGLLNAILDLLEASLRPTVLVIEDTQWADEATLDAIRYLGRRMTQTRGLLILTYREGAVDYDHPLRAVIGELPPQQLVRISLKGLSPEAVESISRGTDLDPAELFALTDGNPLFVVELLTSGSSGVPDSIQDSVLARAAKVSTEARAALDLMSVFPGGAIREVIDELIPNSTELLEECAGQGLVDFDDTAVAFRHELTRRSVESALSPERRRNLNHAVLDKLASVPELADPARLAHHAEAAEDADSVLKYAPAAARAATAAGSHREAVEHFRRLRPHLHSLAVDQRSELLEDWAEAEAAVGNYSDAIGLIEDARHLYAEKDDRSGQSRTLVHAAYYHEWAGERSRAEEYARQATEVLGPSPDGTDLADALEVSAYLAMMGCDADAMDLVDRTLAAAGSEIDEQLLIRCLIYRGEFLHTHYPDGLPFFEEAIVRARAAGLWEEEARALGNHAWEAILFRDLESGEDYVKRALAVCAEHSDTSTCSYQNVTYASLLELRGDWNTAEDIAREEVAHQDGYVRTAALPILGRIEARQGRRAASETLKEAWELAKRSDEVQRLAAAASALAEYAWISGTEIVPAAELKNVLRRCLEVGWSWPPGAIAFWLWQREELGEVPESIAAPYRMMMSDEGIAAARIWESLQCRYDAAIALSLGDSETQIQAIELLETLGASAVAARVRQRLRSQGVSVPRGRASSTRAHPVGLTSRQSEILLLLAEGLTNIEIADRLFLSPRTVENHVAAVVSKLNAASRDRAVAVAREKGLLESTQQATTV